MKTQYFFAALLSLVCTSLFAKVDLSGTWEGIYINNHSHSDSLISSVYQKGDSIYGTLTEGDRSYLLYGQVTNEDDSIYVFLVESLKGSKIYAKCAIYNDSISFTYATQNGLTTGYGHVKKTSPSRTLALHYNYAGYNDVSMGQPLFIELFDNPNILSSKPIKRIAASNTSGTIYITGIPIDTTYCMVYTGYSDSIITFFPVELSYFVYGNSKQLLLDKIIIKKGNIKELTMDFDDTYTYPMTAHFPEGKFNITATYSLPSKPIAIASNPIGEIFIVDINNRIFHYNKNIELQDTLEDDTESFIYAKYIEFAADSSFYTYYAGKINHYSKTRTFMDSKSVGYYITDLEVDASGNVYYSTTTSITRLNPDLSMQLATLDLPAIKAAYPDIDLSCEIRSIALSNDNKIAIGIDAEPDDDGKDVVLFYDNNLTQFDHAIWEEWLFNNPTNMTFDADNNIFVLNYWNDIMIEFNSSDELSRASYWSDLPGKQNGAMDGPSDLTVIGNTIYVIEDVNNRLSIFNTSCASPMTFTYSQAICSGEYFEWHDLKITKAGKYTDTLQTTQGCDMIYEITVTQKPTPPTPIVTVDNTNNKLTSSAIQGNQWYSFTDGAISGATSESYIVTNAGKQYFVIVTENGCLSLPSDAVSIEKTAINIIANNIDIELYPNPARNILNIKQGQGIILQSIIIIDIAGRQMLITNQNQINTNLIDISKLSGGIYNAILNTNMGEVNYRFIKK